MEKIAVGGGLPPDVVSLDDSVAANLRNLARAKKCEISDLTACVLDRDRHEALVAHCLEAGARVMLISDGDVAGVIATAMPDADIDIYLGSGGAPEGVLSAAALRCLGGQMQGRLLYEADEQIERVRAMGHPDPKRCFTVEEMAAGDVMFAATGVTNGAMLRGVRRRPGSAITHSIVMRSRSGTVRFIEAHHNFEQKTWTPT